MAIQWARGMSDDEYFQIMAPVGVEGSFQNRELTAELRTLG
jgi:hypothetical protein